MRRWAALLFVLTALAGCGREDVVREGHTTSEWIATVEESPDREMRIQAITILGDLGPDESSRTADCLTAAMKDPDPVIRWHALNALGKLGPKNRQVTETVARALSDKDRRIARKAVKVNRELLQESIKAWKKPEPPPEEP